MMRLIDNFINSITMYRLTLYGLIALAAVAVIFGFTGTLAYGGWMLLGSVLLLVATCYGSNVLLARAFRAARNVESALITGLILFLIMPPATSWRNAPLLVAAGVIAMASKYLLAIDRKHLFNPTAVAAVIIGLATGGGAIWSVGSSAMAPFVTVVGLLMVRKIRQFHLVVAFWAASLATIVVTGGAPLPSAPTATAALDFFNQTFNTWPILFFGFIMLTEPLTSPPTKRLQVAYGLLVGLLFGSSLHVGPIYATPEVSLVIGNLFAYAVSSKKRLRLTLKEKTQLTPDSYHFSFIPDRRLAFRPGQYLEWTLPHHHSDRRGNRRYFTIASGPNEPTIGIGVKINQHSSSFKRALLALQPGEVVTAGQLAGDFTLPEDARKVALIAGGIGITPFRSMVRSFIDADQRRDVILLYAGTSASDFAYRDVFDQAKQKIGFKTVYVITNKDNVQAGWSGEAGYLTPAIIERQVPDYRSRTFYLSGPDAMVRSYRRLLRTMGVARGQIKVDYFPGY